MHPIPFNKPFLTGNESIHINEVISSGRLSGNGKYTHLCQDFFCNTFGFKKCFLTTSCTDALEMAAILIDIKPGDEIILPSYTFVSSANAFILRGAKVVFADSNKLNPNIDTHQIESLITSKTKAIVVVHYAGIACDMELIMNIASAHNLYVIEDAAQAIDSYYIYADGSRKALGSFGHLATFSFHETKNISSGEGGMLVINEDSFIARAETVYEKGTNRAQFLRNEIDKYQWMDVGSSFMPAEIVAAFLWSQLQEIQQIHNHRLFLWNLYYSALENSSIQSDFNLPFIPQYAAHNAHIFYIVCSDHHQRIEISHRLKQSHINSCSHYQSLHNSPFFLAHHPKVSLPYTEKFTNCLLRLPLFHSLQASDIDIIADCIS
jgi:dTDP-4-amino-4,6-dideoxygalactose transaminase